MAKMILKNLVKKLSKDEEGATAIEYGLLAALIAVAIVLVVVAVGQNLGEAFQSVNTSLESAPAQQVSP